MFSVLIGLFVFFVFLSSVVCATFYLTFNFFLAKSITLEFAPVFFVSENLHIEGFFEFVVSISVLVS